MTAMTPAREPRRWPLAFIAAPAAVAVWSGWVGLGTLSGFGIVHPLPGILPGFQLNTAITLPVGVEAYGAYALGAWLAPLRVPERARAFARRSAVGALALGMAGQVIYHLLAAAGAVRAPWPVVVLVSCMPVVTLGFGAALTHLLRAGESAAETPEAVPAVAVADTEAIVPPAIVADTEATVTATEPAADAAVAVASKPRAVSRQNGASPGDRKRAKAAALVAANDAITPQELAAKCGVSERTAQRWMIKIRDGSMNPFMARAK